MGLVLTASYRRAPAAVAVAELLRRQNIHLAGVLLTRSLNPRRIKSFIRQRGLRATLRLGRKLRGAAGNPRSKILSDAMDSWQIKETRIDQWCHSHGVACHGVSSLNSEQALGLIRSEDVEGVIYTGGGILRSPFLEAVGGRVLNAHAGKLPEIRGMNACEWSILLDVPLAVTIHLIDKGIDTGQSVETIPVDADADDSLEDVRERCVVTGIEGLVRNAENLLQIHPIVNTTPPKYRQCFVMAPALREIVEKKWELVRSQEVSP